MRLFTAVELSDTTRKRVAEFRDDLLHGLTGLRPVPTANLHVTVHFLGSVPTETVPRVVDALTETSADVPPGAATVRGAGAFPKRTRPSVVWAGIDDPSDALTRLHAAVTNALAPLGHPAEERRYHPHITVARVMPARGSRGRVPPRERAPRERAPQELTRRLQVLRREAPSLGALPVDHLTLYSSTFDRTSSGEGGHGRRGGPRYERVARLALRGHAGEDSRFAPGGERY